MSIQRIFIHQTRLRSTMEGTLATTNMLLFIMTAAMGLETLLLIGACIAGLIAYRQVRDLLNGLEEHHVRPLAARVDAILGNVQEVTSTVRQETRRVDEAIHTSVDRVDDTAARVRSNLRAKTSRLVCFVRAVRFAIEATLKGRHTPPADAPGHP
jgi:hypothetical protein